MDSSMVYKPQTTADRLQAAGINDDSSQEDISRAIANGRLSKEDATEARKRLIERETQRQEEAAKYSNRTNTPDNLENETNKGIDTNTPKPTIDAGPPTTAAYSETKPAKANQMQRSIRQQNKPQDTPEGFEWVDSVVETDNDDVRQYVREWTLHPTKEAQTAKVLAATASIPAWLENAKKKVAISDPKSMNFGEVKDFLLAVGLSENSATSQALDAVRDGFKPGLEWIEKVATKSIPSAAKRGFLADVLTGS
jgi:hypothetical protein